MEEATRRRRGRPLGSKNKRFSLAQTIRQFCETKKYDPVQALYDIATFQDKDPDGNPVLWEAQHVIKARIWLADAVQNEKLHPELAAGLTSDSGQLTLAFIAADDNPALPGTTAAEVDPGIHGSIPVQRSGDSQAVREDGLRDKQTHPGDFSVLSADA